MPIRRFFCAVIALFSVSSSAHALGMIGQPAPSDLVLRQTVRHTYGILAPGAEKNRARPQLMMLVEANPSADLVDRFALSLRDENTYTAILATYEDALAAQTDPQIQTFIRFNILRTIVGRAAYMTTRVRRDLLTRATGLAETLAKANRSDPAVWEVTGDLYSLKDDLPNAVAAYRREGSTGSPVQGWYKTAKAYQRLGKWGKARESYEEGIRADTAMGSGRSGREARHLLYQGLASLYISQGREKFAAEALLMSAKVKPDTASPYPMRLDIAQDLLHRGFAKQVVEYTDAVLKITPGDEGAQRLRAAAVSAAAH